MSFRILGVDPGSRFTGWAVLDLPSYGKPMGVVSCGLIDAGRDRFPSNLGRIYAELKEVISEYSPSLMSLESIFSGVNPSSLIKLSQARGVIILLSSQFDLKLKEYPARYVKKSVAGYGNADKDQVKAALGLIFSDAGSSYGGSSIKSFLDGKADPNITDALAIAVCCATDMSNFV